MKIIRDGIEFELTEQELADACHEWARLCHHDDILSNLDWWCDENGVAKEKIGEDMINEIIDEYEDRLWWHEEDHRDSIAVSVIEDMINPDDYKEE